MNYAGGDVYAVTWDDLNAAGLYGEILIMCEPGGSDCNGGYDGTSGLRRMYWNSQTQQVETEAILWNGQSQGFDGYWEGGCFTRGGSSTILPGGFNFCYYTGTTPGTTYLSSIQISTTEVQNYGYTGTSNFNFSSNGIPSSKSGTMIISIIQDSLNGFFLQIVNGQPNNNNGYVDLSVVYNGPSDSNLLLRIENNAGDYYFWQNNEEGKFIWSWSSGTRGVVIGPIGAIIAMKMFSFSFTINGVYGIDTVIITDIKSSTTINIQNGTTFEISRISCQCNQPGNDSYLKQCDSSEKCCQANCQYAEMGTLCAASTNSCISTSYCTGNSGTCPPQKTYSQCNCTPPYYGFDCTEVQCDLLSTCEQCFNFSKSCSWCCNQQCVPISQCPTPAKSCAICSNTTCVHGTCNCGNCTCDPGLKIFLTKKLFI